MSANLNYLVLPCALVEDLAAKHDVRFYLNDPYLDLRGKKPMLVATNGHLLAAAPVEVSGDVPQGPIPLEAIKRVRKDQKHKANPDLYFADDDMCGTGKVMFKREHMDCKYPDWTQLIPKLRNGTSPDITFDARYFQTMQNALAPGVKLGEAGVAVFLQRDKKGVVDPRGAFRVKCKRNDDVVGVIMPMQWD